MKKKALTLLVMVLFALGAFSQNIVIVNGYVTDAQSGNPFVNYKVNIEIMDSIGGAMIYDSVYTNSNGYYADSITVSAGSQGYVTAMAIDTCSSTLIAQTGYYSPNQMVVNLDFQLCANPPSGCVADYTYYATGNPFEISFNDNSTGSPDTWAWDFGDGSTSALQNPVHTFGQAGTYQVCMTISNSDSNNLCNDIVCYSIYVYNDTTSTNCESSFTYYTNDSLTFSFNGYMVDSNNYSSVDYSWDFGDGTYGSGQSVTHTFQATGTTVYTVCLTTIAIELNGDTCVFISCQDVYISNPGGGGNCVADFYYYQTGNPLEVAFYDNSTGNPDTWSWSFGDGTTSAIQSPVHTYSQQGTYYVCLTIASNDSSGCNDTQCYYVTVIDSTAGNYTGIVYLQNQMTADAGVVYLMEYDSLGGGVSNIQTTSIDPSNGSYTFSSVSPGLYYIQAELDNSSAYYMQYLPTYHLSSLYWTSANLVWFNTGVNYDVYMIPADSNNYAGPGQIGGTVTQITDNTVENMEVMLMNSNGDPINYYRIDEYGQFDFSNLEYGTYYLHVEMPGITNDQIMIVIDANNPSQNVNIIIENGNAYVGIDDPGVMSFENIGEIYPNPVIKNASIKLSSNKSQTITINILNQLGQLISTKQYNIDEGMNILNIESSSLLSGLYYLNIASEKGENINKILVKN